MPVACPSHPFVFRGPLNEQARVTGTGFQSVNLKKKNILEKCFFILAPTSAWEPLIPQGKSPREEGWRVEGPLSSEVTGWGRDSDTQVTGYAPTKLESP